MEYIQIGRLTKHIEGYGKKNGKEKIKYGKDFYENRKPIP